MRVAENHWHMKLKSMVKRRAVSVLLLLKNNVKVMNAFCIMMPWDGVFKDTDQTPGVYANVTQASQEGVFRRKILT